MDFTPLGESLKLGEAWIMDRLLAYAKQTCYVKYTSTLLEAWRFSVEGLTEAIREGALHYRHIPELHPDEDYTREPLAAFGIVEARKHRARGVTLALFLGLMKYYRQSYRDYLKTTYGEAPETEAYVLFTERCFDRIELGFVTEWSGREQSEVAEEMRVRNIEITNEKNRYLTIFESLSQPVLFVGEKGEILNLNLVAAELFTDDPKSGFYYYHPADRPQNLAWLGPLVAETERHGEGLRTEKRLATCQGERVFQIAVKKNLDVSGKFMGWIVILTDLTEVRQAEDTLRKSEEHYQYLFEHCPSPYQSLDENGRLIDVNQALISLLGHSRDELLGADFLSLLPAGQGDRFRACFDAFKQQGQVRDVEYDLIRKDGSPVTVAVNGRIIHDREGRLRTHCLLADMTERKIAQERISRLTRVYNVLSQTNQAIVRHREPEALFEEICRIAVVDGHLKLALINRFDPAAGKVKPMAFHGGDAGFLASIELAPWAGDARPNVTARVLDSGRSHICNDIRLDPLLQSRAPEAEGYGFQALASFPLRCQQRLYGTFNLYAREADFFQPDIVALLEEMTADLSFALDNFERELQRQRAEEALVQTSNKLTALFEAAPLPTMAFDRKGRVLMWNPAAEKLFGWREAEVLGKQLPIVPEEFLPEFHEKNRSAFAGRELSGLQVQRQTRDGQRLDLLLFNAPLYDAQQNIYAVMALLMDITGQKKSQEQIAYLAHHDQLTGLANRTLLKERFEQAASRARREGTRLALCVLDLDGFKHVNDLLGHHQGDRLLCQVGERLVGCVRGTDTVCRMGGDEFLVLFSDIAGTTGLTALIRKVSEVFSTPFSLNDHPQSITMSMGVAVFPEDGTDLETLFKNADAAMYYAKDAGRNNVQFFRREISSQIQQRLAIENGLRRALAEDELCLHYQPVCRVSDDRIIGAEALLRWHHPQQGWVAPGSFVPIAEETGLILPMGEWVLEEVCRTIRQWDVQGLPPVPVAINVSAKQVFQEGFPAFVAGTLRHFGIEAGRLELEVTESLFLENLASVEKVMQQLKAIGIGLALDDFGTGYSSLSYLKRFRIDKLKIDRSFVADVCRDEQDAVLTETIILMAKSLGLKAVAEGVETAEQLAFLGRCSCDYYQGFLCSRPVSGEAFAQLLMRTRHAAAEPPAPC